jgi:hypothetical protein
MFLFNGVRINRAGAILEIQYEDKEFLKEKLFVDFQKVNTQYGEHFMFAVKNEGYAERQQLFIKAIESLYRQIADYLSDHVGYDMSPIVIDHKSTLVY